jgi:hypothetical protein
MEENENEAVEPQVEETRSKSVEATAEAVEAKTTCVTRVKMVY